MRAIRVEKLEPAIGDTAADAIHNTFVAKVGADDLLHGER